MKLVTIVLKEDHFNQAFLIPNDNRCRFRRCCTHGGFLCRSPPESDAASPTTYRNRCSSSKTAAALSCLLPSIRCIRRRYRVFPRANMLSKMLSCGLKRSYRMSLLFLKMSPLPSNLCFPPESELMKGAQWRPAQQNAASFQPNAEVKLSIRRLTSLRLNGCFLWVTNLTGKRTFRGIQNTLNFAEDDSRSLRSRQSGYKRCDIDEEEAM